MYIHWCPTCEEWRSEPICECGAYLEADPVAETMWHILTDLYDTHEMSGSNFSDQEAHDSYFGDDETGDEGEGDAGSDNASDGEAGGDGGDSGGGGGDGP